jgi:hypothetical protein
MCKFDWHQVASPQDWQVPLAPHHSTIVQNVIHGQLQTDNHVACQLGPCKAIATSPFLNPTVTRPRARLSLRQPAPCTLFQRGYRIGPDAKGQRPEIVYLMLGSGDCSQRSCLLHPPLPTCNIQPASTSRTDSALRTQGAGGASCLESCHVACFETTRLLMVRQVGCQGPAGVAWGLSWSSPRCCLKAIQQLHGLSLQYHEWKRAASSEHFGCIQPSTYSAHTLQT